MVILFSLFLFLYNWKDRFQLHWYYLWSHSYTLHTYMHVCICTHTYIDMLASGKLKNIHLQLLPCNISFIFIYHKWSSLSSFLSLIPISQSLSKSHCRYIYIYILHCTCKVFCIIREKYLSSQLPDLAISGKHIFLSIWGSPCLMRPLPPTEYILVV